MQTLEVDVAVLGAGTAGLGARRSAESHGASVAMIDPGPFGTTCARVGCMPSKLLISAADAAWEARHAGEFGVHAGDVRVDGAAVMARVQRERDRFVGFVQRSVDRIDDNGQLLKGRGRLIGPHELRVDDPDGKPLAEVTARSIVVATGTSPFVPPPYRALGAHVLLTTDEVFELETLPASLLVVGTGVIGLELGQAMHRLGVRTTLLGRGGGVGPFTDTAVAEESLRLFKSELDIHPSHELVDVRPAAGGAAVRFIDDAGLLRAETFERVLIAAGRRPNLGGLGLEQAGVELEGGAVKGWDHRTMQVGETHVFLAGDVDGYRSLLHEAADEGRIAGRNAATHPSVKAGHRRAALSIVFSSPQMAVVGTPRCGHRALSFASGQVDYGDQGRSRVMNQHRGIVRIYGDLEDGVLTGAEMLGPRVEHTAHLLAWAIQQRMTVDQALTMPFYHPVVEEGIRTALRDLAANLKLARPCTDPCSEVGPGA